MRVVNGFTRKQTQLLTGLNKEALGYLAKQAIIVPDKFGNGIRSAVIYSFLQVMQLRQIYRIREHISLQSMKGIIKFIQSSQNDDRLFSREKIAAINDNYHWISPDLSNLSQFIKAESNKIYTAKLIILQSPFDVFQEINAIAKSNQDVIDFDLFNSIYKSYEPAKQVI